ncbi:hypothetical protein [Robertkochia flava]|uniref:hypothetical protein n=1 Tax=Robertkochia flava TaxID=3447986 RepID=UPI001CCA15A4|nr:hypothetical protein [Robertkochia marina]
MRKFTLLFTLLIASAVAVSAQCTSAYSAASYALAHTKRALNADNFDHQMLYADRGVEAMEKARVLIEDCGCQPALNEMTQGLDNLVKATDPADWEAGRYYTKIAFEHAKAVMGALDQCTMNTTAPATPSSDYELTASADSSTEYIAANSDLISEQEKLEAERRRLEEEQRKLEEKIARQRALAEKARMARARELEEQLVVKQAAEVHLQAVEQSLRDLAESLGCSKAISVLNSSYKRNDGVLENESLEETKAWYLQQTIRMQKDVAAALGSCAQQ